jgi:hypothetical protein
MLRLCEKLCGCKVTLEAEHGEKTNKPTNTQACNQAIKQQTHTHKSRPTTEMKTQEK